MPFTFSHPAAAIPLARFGLVLSALVVGSMAPDFLYFLPFVRNHDAGHTLRGLVSIDLPVGLAALWLFHVFLKRPLLALLPVEHQKRLQPWAGPFPLLPARRLLRIVLSLLVGAMTHLAWDYITHSELYARHPSPLRHLPLAGPLFSRFGIYLLLQYGSTALGAGLIAFWYWKWLKQTPGRRLPPSLIRSWLVRWFLGISIPASAICYALLQGYLRLPRSHLPSWLLLNLLHSMVITAVSVMALLWAAYALLWHLLAAFTSGYEWRADLEKNPTDTSLQAS